MYRVRLGPYRVARGGGRGRIGCFRRMGSPRKSWRRTDAHRMTPVDYFIVLVLVVSAGVGFWRGFVKESLSLLTLLVAIWLAWRFAALIEPKLGNWAADPEVRIWIARVIVFAFAVARRLGSRLGPRAS